MTKMTLKEIEVRLRSAGAMVNPRVRDRMGKLARDIEAEQKRLVPVLTGNLKQSIRVTTGMMTWRIGPVGVPYASYVEHGTKPHVIKPKNGKYLAFTVNGKKVVVTKVNHPGTKPKPYVRPSYEKFEAQVAKDVAKIGSRWWQR